MGCYSFPTSLKLHEAKDKKGALLSLSPEPQWVLGIQEGSISACRMDGATVQQEGRRRTGALCFWAVLQESSCHMGGSSWKGPQGSRLFSGHIKQTSQKRQGSGLAVSS